MSFETFLDATDSEFKPHVINVVDSMELIRQWFKDRGIDATANDLVAAAGLVINQKIAEEQRWHEQQLEDERYVRND